MEFRLLGPVEVVRDGVALGLGGPRERAVLGALVLRANEFAGVSYLVDAVWESAPASPETNLRTYVAGLRRRLGTRPDGSARVVTRDGGYVLVADPEELDVAVFGDLADRGEQALADEDPRAAVAAFTSALDRWRGEPLEGCRLGPGLRADVESLRERRLRVVEQWAAARIRLGEHAAVVEDLRPWVAQFPLREELWAQLMIGLCHAGRRAEAVEVYAQVRQQLVDELGVEPGSRLRQLHTDILADDAGEVGPRMAADPALRPAQLPADLPAFVGRDTELTRLADDLDGSAVVISSIDGMAGIGKTALAVHAAHRLADQYPDGQLFVDLHGHTVGVAPTEPAQALDHLLRALGVPGEMVPHDLAAAAALYRSRLAGRRVLIVLDNAADETQIEPLLPGSPGCLVLITSRRRLTNLDLATPLTLDILPESDAIALFTSITGRPADPGLVPEVVRLCGQLPLAVRIAAARLRARPSWTLTHLADRLRDHRRRLGELSAGQRGVAAAIDLSYDQLDPTHQRVFRLLGLHPGTDVDAAATAALTGLPRDDAEDVLETLFDAHLLHQHLPDRYQLHDLVRAHAAQTCAAEDPEPARREALTRLLDHYAATATAAVDVAYPAEIHRPRWPDPAAPPADEASAVAWLNAELANLLDVAVHAAAHGWPAHTVHLSATLYRHLDIRAYVAEAERLHTDAVTCARQVGDRTGELAALNAVGMTLREHGDRDVVLDCFHRAFDLARELGNRWGELIALRGRARIELVRGKFALAGDLYQRALAIATEIGDYANECDLLCSVGMMHSFHGEYDAAIDRCQQGLRIATDHGDRSRESYAQFNLGQVFRKRGDFEQAAECYARCERLAKAVGNRKSELYSVQGLGRVHHAMGRPAAAIDCHQQALRLARGIGDRNFEYEALLGLGNSCLAVGEPGSALAHHHDALALAVDLGQPTDQARAHNGIAAAHHTLGDDESARAHWTRCLTLLDELGLTEIGELGAEGVRASLAALT
jgi:DNA-binding SARP family transcriptional activator/tetratricopeptide (TPR) repeat protein